MGKVHNIAVAAVNILFGLRQGAITLSLGLRAIMVSSKRTWSLPLPVQPCAMASAPSFSAISTIFLAIKGRAMEVPNR